MGNRANVHVHSFSQPGVYLYTHSSGHSLPDVVREALSREERWDDAMYLARIIFSAMIRNDIDGSTGYGISGTPGEGPIIEIDTQYGMVRWGTEMTDFKEMSFRDYIKECRSW
jgi:hypothetical protein